MTLVAKVTVPTPKCWHCGEAGTVSVSAAGLARWKAGALVQVAFPEVPSEVREQFISGTHPACWTALFGEED